MFTFKLRLKFLKMKIWNQTIIKTNCWQFYDLIQNYVCVCVILLWASVSHSFIHWFIQAIWIMMRYCSCISNGFFFLTKSSHIHQSNIHTHTQPVQHNLLYHFRYIFIPFYILLFIPIHPTIIQLALKERTKNSIVNTHIHI